MENLEIQEAQRQLDEINERNFQQAIEKANIIGTLVNWRGNMKNNATREKVYAGYHKINSFMLRRRLLPS